MTEEPVTPLLVDVLEAARLLGCGPTFVYGMIERGELPVVKLGRLTRIPVIGLKTYISNRVAGEHDVLWPAGPSVARLKR